jgi:hypothetical protein
MNDSVFFATFDPLFINAPETCGVCLSSPPIFNYEYAKQQNETTETQYLKGFCCQKCAAGLLKKLATTEAEEWAEEEAALEADDLDVTDFQKRRLATFGNIVKG